MKQPIPIGGMEPRNPFRSTVAVETWDTWFRWRQDGQLRDVTIEDTWERVASALAANAAHAPDIKQRLINAFAGWHLLPDERLLMRAGVVAPPWEAGDLHAVLNVASFVSASGAGHATFKHAHFEDVAALAVRALENATDLYTGHARQAPRTRVGIIGLGDALALLDLDYASDAARAQAAAIALALAQGCVSGSIALARERGAKIRCEARWIEQARQRGYRRDLIDAAVAHGLRHGRLTAITSQPRLAAFANGVADGLDPVSDGSANAAADAARPTDVAAQLRMRASIQPLIDTPIVYPISIDSEPKAEDIAAWNTLARELDLAPPTWRRADRHADATKLNRPNAMV